MKKYTLKALLSIVAILLLLLSSACSSDNNPKNEAKPTTNEQNEQNEQNVKSKIEANGVVIALDEKSIDIDFPATIKTISVKDGQRIKKGDTILTLDIKDYKNQIKTKELELAGLKQIYNTIKANMDNGTDAELNKLKNSLANTQNNYNKCLKDYETNQELFKKDSISKSELDNSQIVMDEKKSSIEDIKFQIEKYNQDCKNDLNERSSQIKVKESEIFNMKDKLVKSFLKDSTIICESDNSLVTNLQVVTGQIIDNNIAIAKIINLDSLVILADVDETEIRDIKIGSEASIIPIADKTKKYTGKIKRITDKAIVKNGETFVQIEIEISDKDNLLQIGYNVDVIIDEKK